MRGRRLVQGATHWVFGTSYGPHPEVDGVVLNVFRRYERRVSKKDGLPLMAHGDVHGLVVKDQDEADRIALERGLLKRYGRNTCKFVQSRAARKRGHVTDDFFFKIRVENSIARRAGKV
jgi:hypothetical protein